MGCHYRFALFVGEGLNMLVFFGGSSSSSITEFISVIIIVVIMIYYDCYSNDDDCNNDDGVAVSSSELKFPESTPVCCMYSWYMYCLCLFDLFRLLIY